MTEAQAASVAPASALSHNNTSTFSPVVRSPQIATTPSAGPEKRLTNVVIAGKAVMPGGSPKQLSSAAIKVRTANGARRTAPIITPPYHPSQQENGFFITEVAIAQPQSAPEPQQITIAETKTVNNRTKTVGFLPAQQRLPPVQHLSLNVLRRAQMRPPLPPAATNVKGDVYTVQYGTNDSQHTLPSSLKKKNLVAIPLRSQEAHNKQVAHRITEITAQLSKMNNFGHSFAQYKPQHNDDIMSVVSRVSRTSTPPPSEPAGDIATPKESSIIPPISNGGSARASTASGSAKSHKSGSTGSRSARSSGEAPENLPPLARPPRLEDNTHNNEKPADQQEAELDITEEDLLSSFTSDQVSLISGSSVKTQGTHHSVAKSHKSGSHISVSNIGSDAEHDRIVQIEENLRAEKRAREKVQKQLEDVLAKQEALLRQLSPEERENVFELTKKDSKDAVFIDMQKKYKKHRSHKQRETKESKPPSVVSTPKQSRLDRSQSPEELQKLVAEMYQQMQVMTSVSNDKTIQRMMNNIKNKHPELNTIASDAIVPEKKNFTTFRTGYVVDHKGQLLFT